MSVSASRRILYYTARRKQRKSPPPPVSAVSLSRWKKRRASRAASLTRNARPRQNAGGAGDRVVSLAALQRVSPVNYTHTRARAFAFRREKPRIERALSGAGRRELARESRPFSGRNLAHPLVVSGVARGAPFFLVRGGRRCSNHRRRRPSGVAGSSEVWAAFLRADVVVSDSFFLLVTTAAIVKRTVLVLYL